MNLPCPAFAALCLVALTGCAWLKPAGKEKPDKTTNSEAPKLVGRIASIPPDKRFVLIQSYGGWKIEAGTILTTRGPENRSANLLATGESLGEFAAADLQSGAVEVGDGVYSRHTPKPPEITGTVETPAETAEIQMKPESENVQKNN